jgi:hypothetical protein
MSWRSQLGRVVILYLILGILLRQIQHYSAQDYRIPGGGPDIQHQLNWIGKKLRDGSGESTQAWYPEGFFFAHALYGYALVNQGLLNLEDEALVRRNTEEIKWVLKKLDSEAGYAPFPRDQAVRYGVFYQGWRNRLLGGLLLLQEEDGRDPAQEEQFHMQSEMLAQAFVQSPTFHLEAYPGGCWPVDNVIALSSLLIHDDLYGTEYKDVVAHWLGYSHAHLDPQTGLIPHRIDAGSGQILQGSRGSSLVLILSFLPELDAEFASAQYIRFRELYSRPVLDFVLTREYPRGVFGLPDVDSGPLVAGLSPVASGVSLAAARANGDDEIFERMIQLAELLGVPISFGNEKRYSLGALMVGDAFLAWGKTILPWKKDARATERVIYPRLTPTFHGWSYLIALLLAVGIWIPFFRSRKKRVPM